MGGLRESQPGRRDDTVAAQNVEHFPVRFATGDALRSKIDVILLQGAAGLAAGVQVLGWIVASEAAWRNVLFATLQKFVALAVIILATCMDVVSRDGIEDRVVFGTRVSAIFAQGPDAGILPFFS